jgi:hypothetical protein
MKHIKKYENYSIGISDINSYLKESTFDDLPLDFKKGLLTWMVDGDAVEWTFKDAITDWTNDENVDVAILDYSRERGNVKYSFGYVPTNLIIERISPIIIDEYDYESFEEWHQAYQSTNLANHGDSMFPIIVNDDFDEWVEDGWHRLNYYLNKKNDTIPVIKL